MRHRKGSETLEAVTHRRWSQSSIGHSLGGRTLGSLCCELLRHIHPSPPLGGIGPAPEAVFGFHPGTAHCCHRSSLGTDKVDLFVPNRHGYTQCFRFPHAPSFPRVTYAIAIC
jgi:hypothetical protein